MVGGSAVVDVVVVKGSLEIKIPTTWTDGKAQPARSSDMEKVRREKIRDGEDQIGRKSEERSCRCAKEGGKSRNIALFFQFL